jgi:hypothetical protein
LDPDGAFAIVAVTVVDCASVTTTTGDTLTMIGRFSTVTGASARTYEPCVWPPGLVTLMKRYHAPVLANVHDTAEPSAVEELTAPGAASVWLFDAYTTTVPPSASEPVAVIENDVAVVT